MGGFEDETFARLHYLLGGLRPVEIIYLRLSLGPTVIVTTAVHWGFSRRLPCHQVRHWVGINPHTWSYDFVDTCVFGKQSPRPAILSSSLERVVSRPRYSLPTHLCQFRVQRLVLEHWFRAFSLPLLTLKK
ncbi:hypothetical protein V6Z12_A07G144600 [Gossypium hirsutum]